MLLLPSFKDAVTIRMEDKHRHLGENYLAAKVGKRAQVNEGMGEGWHYVALLNSHVLSDVITR
jgi:hypothetical protein